MTQENAVTEVEKKTFTKADVSEEMVRIQVEVKHSQCIGAHQEWDALQVVFEAIMNLAKVKPVVIAGVGKFFIQRTKPRGRKAELGIAYVPKLKFKAAAKVQTALLDGICNGLEYGAVEVVRPTGIPTGRPNPFIKRDKETSDACGIPPNETSEGNGQTQSIDATVSDQANINTEDITDDATKGDAVQTFSEAAQAIDSQAPSEQVSESAQGGVAQADNSPEKDNCQGSLPVSDGNYTQSYLPQESPAHVNEDKTGVIPADAVQESDTPLDTSTEAACGVPESIPPAETSSQPEGIGETSDSKAPSTAQASTGAGDPWENF